MCLFVPASKKSNLKLSQSFFKCHPGLFFSLSLHALALFFFFSCYRFIFLSFFFLSFHLPIFSSSYLFIFLTFHLSHFSPFFLPFIFSFYPFIILSFSSSFFSAFIFRLFLLGLTSFSFSPSHLSFFSSPLQPWQKLTTTEDDSVFKTRSRYWLCLAHLQLLVDDDDDAKSLQDRKRDVLATLEKAIDHLAKPKSVLIEGTNKVIAKLYELVEVPVTLS